MARTYRRRNILSRRQPMSRKKRMMKMMMKRKSMKRKSMKRKLRSRSRRGATITHSGWKNNLKHNNQPCLVVYHMNGCGACMHFKSTWNKYVTDHENQCAIAVERHDSPSKHGMNLDEHMKKVGAFPTIMMVDRKGEVLGTKVGAVDENNLDIFVKSYVRN